MELPDSSGNMELISKKRENGTRFGVSTNDGLRSSVWRVWSNKLEICAAPKFKTGDFKFSFHERHWRFDFTKLYTPLIDQESTGISTRPIADFPVPVEHVPEFK